MSLDKIVFAEKYRPRTLNDCVLPDAVKNQVREMIDSGNIPSLLLCGSAGTGKTTLARAIVSEMDGDMLFINASLENGIDTIRTKVMQYASSVSMEGKPKFILFDEFDGLTRNAMESLRGIIEEFKNVRFFFTCNYKNRIIDAIISRTTTIDFTYSSNDKPKLAGSFFKRVLNILDAENIQYDKATVAALVSKHFPDFRRVLNELQRYSAGGKIDVGILADNSKNHFTELFELLKTNNFTEMRKWTAKNTDIEPQSLFRALYDQCASLMVPSCLPQLVLTLADYSFKSTHSVDQEILVAAALTEVMSIAKWK